VIFDRHCEENPPVRREPSRTDEGEPGWCDRATVPAVLVGEVKRGSGATLGPCDRRAGNSQEGGVVTGATDEIAGRRLPDRECRRAPAPRSCDEPDEAVGHGP